MARSKRPDFASFGARLKYARETVRDRGVSREYSKSELAREIGVKPQRITQVEGRSLAKDPELSFTPGVKAARLLRVRIGWLAFNEPPIETPAVDVESIGGDLLILVSSWAALFDDDRKRFLRRIQREATKAREHRKQARDNHAEAEVTPTDSRAPDVVSRRKVTAG